MTTKVSEHEKREQEHAEYASRAFARHEITERMRLVKDNEALYGSWSCGRPGDSTYRFHITHEPGRLFVTGDIGDLMVERTFNMIVWSRSAVNSISYFAEKVPHALETREFSAALALEFVADQIAESLREGETERAKKWQTLSDDIGDSGDDWESEHNVRQAIYDSGLCDDQPSMMAFNSNFLWCREAVKWWLARITDDGMVIQDGPRHDASGKGAATMP